jgi:hypothetical protein
MVAKEREESRHHHTSCTVKSTTYASHHHPSFCNHLHRCHLLPRPRFPVARYLPTGLWRGFIGSIGHDCFGRGAGIPKRLCDPPDGRPETDRLHGTPETCRHALRGDPRGTLPNGQRQPLIPPVVLPICRFALDPNPDDDHAAHTSKRGEGGSPPPHHQFSRQKN